MISCMCPWDDSNHLPTSHLLPSSPLKSPSIRDNALGVDKVELWFVIILFTQNQS
jgi:hypothetical protein